jgi:KN motif
MKQLNLQMLVEMNNTASWGPPTGPPPQKPAMKQKCECCPYGYHIDLDFVRYCEAFNSKTSSPSSKLRERRRQRQSMEVLLGITSPTMWQLEQQVPQVCEYFLLLWLSQVVKYILLNDQIS